MPKQKLTNGLAQVFEEITSKRNAIAGNKGEAIIMGGMKNQAIRYDDANGDGMGFNLVDGHFYLILEIPVGEKFTIKDDGGMSGFYTMGKNGIER